MPVHDWSRLQSNLLQHFHGQWISQLVDLLNGGVLPDGYFATGQQTAGIYIPDSLVNRELANPPPIDSGSTLLSAPPQTTVIEALEEVDFTRRQRSVLIQRNDGRGVAAIIEIVSAGNKSSERALHQFVRKAVDAILQGCHLLVVDLQRPTRRDPNGVHHEIWQELGGKPFSLRRDKPFTLAADTIKGYDKRIRQKGYDKIRQKDRHNFKRNGALVNRINVSMPTRGASKSIACLSKAMRFALLLWRSVSATSARHAVARRIR